MGSRTEPPDKDYTYPYCNDISKYEKIFKIGQGTFGEVFKARENCQGGKVVALKKILMENEQEGFPITALREIKILQLLRHENIVTLYEICRSKSQAKRKFKPSIYLVFEFCEHDLAGLLKNPEVKFSAPEKKKIANQLFTGLHYIHKNKILHRDMKTANILITRNGVLKLADFGLARAFSSTNRRYTNRVVTLWYRPPELILGEKEYGPEVDIWGAGCIVAELWTEAPLMQGNTEQEQLNLICNLCGSITPEVWPSVRKFDLFKKMNLPENKNRKIKERLRLFVRDNYALDLLDKLFILDPAKRINSEDALDHDFFWNDPMPANDLSAAMGELITSNFDMFSSRQGRQGRHGKVGGTANVTHSKVF